MYFGFQYIYQISFLLFYKTKHKLHFIYNMSNLIDNLLLYTQFDFVWNLPPETEAVFV